MKKKCKGFIFVFLLVLSGCTMKVDYIWDEYPITPDRILSQNIFNDGKEIRIITGQSDNFKEILGKVGPAQYYGSEQSFTDGIVTQLALELQKKNLIINYTSEKSLEISVNRSYSEIGMWKFAATLEFTVKFGNGKIKSYIVRNSSPTNAVHAYNGAVALAVIEIMNDLEVLTYINE